MTHDELLAKINAIQKNVTDDVIFTMPYKALYAVVELHKPITPNILYCSECRPRYNGDPEIVLYPCPTVQTIEKELK